MNWAQLPLELPAGIWIRGSYGPVSTYAKARLIRPGERRRTGAVAHEAVYESGGPGSDEINFLPENVFWDAVNSLAAREEIEQIVKAYSSLGGGRRVRE